MNITQHILMTVLVAVAYVACAQGVIAHWPLAETFEQDGQTWLKFDGFETRQLESWWDYGPAKDTWQGDRIRTTDLNRPIPPYELEPLSYAQQSMEYRFNDNIQRVRQNSNTGQWALKIRTTALDDCRGANVTFRPKQTLFWLTLRPDSRIRFHLRSLTPNTLATVTLWADKDHIISLDQADLAAGDNFQRFTSSPLADSLTAQEINSITAFTIQIVLHDQTGNIAPEFLLDDIAISNCLPSQLRQGTVSSTADHNAAGQLLNAFKDRRRAYRPTLLFDKMDDWQLILGGNWQATLSTTNTEPLFPDTPTVGQLTYQGDGPGWAEIRPDEPPVISDPINLARLWVYGPYWAWMNPANDFAGFLVELTDHQGKRHYIDCCRYMAKYWNLLLARIHPQRYRIVGGDNIEISLPARLTALVVYGQAVPEPRTLYLDSVTLCREEPAQPQSPPTLPDQDEPLPIPTTPDTFLPSTLTPVTNQVTHNDDTTALIAQAQDETLIYEYIPAQGSLSDLTAILPDGTRVKPAGGAGPAVWFNDHRVGPDNPDVNVKLLKHQQLPDRVITTWQWQQGTQRCQYELSLQIKGKTIIADWTGLQGTAAGLITGTIENVNQPRFIDTPCMLWLHPAQKPLPKIVLADRHFYFTHLDLHNSNAFAISGCADSGDTWAICNGDAFYVPNSLGETATLRERQFITISCQYEEILPNIPNPPSPKRDVMAGGIYWHGGGAISTESHLQMLQQWHQLGIDSAFYSQHEAIWTEYDTVCQGPQAFSFTTDLSPEIDKDRFIEIMDEMLAMGYHVGPYFNPNDYSPLGRSFDERHIARATDMSPLRAWPPCWGIKPRTAAEMTHWFLPENVDTYHFNTAYMDTLTAFAPWRWVDGDGREPGACQLTTNYLQYSRFALAARRYITGPVFSEGGFQWFYAGLHEGSYGWHAEPYDNILLLDFRLKKIGPLMSAQCKGPFPEVDAPEPIPAIAATIIWNNIASGLEGPPHLMYYLTVPLQKRYVMQPVEEILYAQDDNLYPVTQAILNHAVENNQVLIRYENGLQMAVNGSTEAHWNVTLDGQDFILPPGGWAAVQGDELLSLALKVDGRWLAATYCPQWTVVVPYDGQHTFGNIVTDTPLVVRYDTGDQPRVIPFEQEGELVEVDGMLHFRK